MSDFLCTVDPLAGSFATLVRLPKQLLASGRSCSRDLSQVSNSYQIVNGGSELKDPTHPTHSAVSSLAQQPHRLQPAEDFCHSFALALTSFITRMARGALVNSAAATSFVVLRHVRHHLTSAQVSHKVFRVVTFVTTYRHPFLLRSLLQHCQRRLSLGRTTGLSQQGIDHQAVAIFHQHV